MKKILFVFAAILLLANGVSAQNGYSTYTWPDGNNKFEGYFVNGVMHGSGIHYWNDNHYVVGQWVNGTIDGYCIEIQNGAHKLVYYENGKAATRNVRSNQTLNTGVGIYTGEMSNGRACGKGTFRWNSGLCFEGTWTADGKSRYGVLYYPNTRKPWHIGTWTNEQFDGYGCIVSESGQLTVGLWQNGEYLCKSKFISSTTDLQELQQMIDQTQSSLPIKINDDISFTKIFIADGCYTMQFDISYTSYQNMKDSYNQMRKTLYAQLNSDPANVDIMKLLTKLNLQMKYIYKYAYGNNQIEFVFTTNELQSLIK